MTTVESPIETNATKESVDVLDRSETDPSERIEHVEWILGNREATIEDALVAFAVNGKHVLLVEEASFEEFRDLCRAAAERDHDVTCESVIDRSIEIHGDPEAIQQALLNHEGFDEQTRQSRLNHLRDDAQTGPSIGEAADRDDETTAVTPGVDEVFEREVSDGVQPSDGAVPSADNSKGVGPADSPDQENESDDRDEIGTDEESAPTDQDSTPTAPNDRHTGTLDPPQQSDPTVQGALSIPNYVQDLIQFEYVLDGDDPSLPADVNETGIVVLDEGHYVGLLRVRPRTWSIHTETEKSRIIDAYRSSFLATLDFPVQIVSYPSKFDISDHVRRLEEVLETGRANSEESDLLTIGRELYPNWLERFILDNDMKQRQFYVAVPVSADKIAEEQDPHTGLLDTIGETVPPLEGVTDWIGGSDAEVSDDQCLRELDSRLSRIASALRRVDVTTERVEDRTEALSICYHYYNNERPEDGTFPTGPYAMTRRGDEE